MRIFHGIAAIIAGALLALFLSNAVHAAHVGAQHLKALNQVVTLGANR